MAYHRGDPVEFPVEGTDQTVRGTVECVAGNLVAIKPQEGQYPIVVRQLNGAELVMPPWPHQPE